MSNYQNLKKGKRYSFQFNGRRVRSGKYLGRYFNHVLRQWHYYFEICTGYYITPAACKTKIF